MGFSDSFGSGFNFGSTGSGSLDLSGSILDSKAAVAGMSGGGSDSSVSSPVSASSGGISGVFSNALNWLEHTAVIDLNKITSGIKLPPVKTQVSVNPMIYIGGGLLIVFYFFFKNKRK
jgi:hypothetical protein